MPADPIFGVFFQRDEARELWRVLPGSFTADVSRHHHRALQTAGASSKANCLCCQPTSPDQLLIVSRGRSAAPPQQYPPCGALPRRGSQPIANTGFPLFAARQLNTLDFGQAHAAVLVLLVLVSVDRKNLSPRKRRPYDAPLSAWSGGCHVVIRPRQQKYTWLTKNHSRGGMI